jgi:sarcosine oxidase subunit alpha
MTPVEAGMAVRSQNAWPSLTHDVMAVFDRLDRFLPVGFYYKTFIRPRAMWPAYERVLRRAAGLGAIDPDPHRFQVPYYDKQYRHAEVTIVGGGPAGMSAALESAERGARVVLIDENPELGGHLRYQVDKLSPDVTSELAPYPIPNTQYTDQLGRELAAAVRAHENIELLTEATAFGWYEGNLLGVVQGDRLIKLRTAQLVVATGRTEQPLIFHNNDLPGVILGSGLQRLMNLYDIRPGRRALVVTNSDLGWSVARDLLARDVEVALVLDARPEIHETEAVAQVRAAGVAGLPSHTIQAAKGNGAVEGAVAVRLERDGNTVPGTEIELKCDLVSVSPGFVANNALLYQSGCRLRYDPQVGDVVPLSFAPGVRGAGHAVATRGLAPILLDGRVAGLEAALSLDSPAPPRQMKGDGGGRDAVQDQLTSS